MNLLHTLTTVVAEINAILPADPLDIGDSSMVAPPGMAQKAGTLIGVARWVGGVWSIASLVGLGISVMGNDRRKDNNEKAGNATWWALGSLLVSSAVTIAAWVVG